MLLPGNFPWDKITSFVFLTFEFMCLDSRSVTTSHYIPVYILGIEFVISFVIITTVAYIGFKKRWHEFSQTTVTHLVWSPIVIWYMLLSFRLTGCTICATIWMISFVLFLFHFLQPKYIKPFKFKGQRTIEKRIFFVL